MKIYAMRATFGKLEHAELTLKPGFNLIEAPNEWGKSTWCAFLVAMLYGIDTRERSTASTLAVKERYAPWSGAPMQGRIDLCWNGRDITSERATRGRAIFGDFKAYETQSGVAVPELTADNCGKLLLGVEKSVFTRTGFIRLADMPVTQDEALRRRLNELVTTGDESGQSDDLAQKLRDLKNKVRSNRTNGLIPQALAEKQQLETRLQQLSALRSQAQQLQQRQAELASHTARLRNHKNHLAWQAAQGRIQRAEEAKARLRAVNEQVAVLESTCATLPSEATLQAQLNQARQLQSQKDNLQLELAMLPPPPAAPQGLALHDPAQAQKDFATYTELSAVTPPAKGLRIAAIAAAVIALAGIGLAAAAKDSLALTILGTCMISIFAGMSAFCFGLQRRQANAYEAAQQLQKELSDRYAPLPPDRWISAAENYVNQHETYQAALAAYEASRTGLQQQLQQVMAQLATLPATDGHSAAANQHRLLADALRTQQHLRQLVQSLEDGAPLPAQPTDPDTLTWSDADTARLLSDAEAETRQLHTRLGQVQGQMEALGSAAAMQQQLDAVTTRLARLEQTYAALELAQNTLAHAATDLQRRFAPAIAQQAKAYLTKITGNRYDKLSLTDELAVHAGASNEDTTLPSLWRSDGTVDQLYLCLRLSVSEALTPEAPLVLDDALVRFDDTRLAETLQLLQEVAAHRQVILFTCQTRERTTLGNGQLTIDN